jgi:hypothetical protein
MQGVAGHGGPEKNNQKKWRAEEEERQKGSLTQKREKSSPQGTYLKGVLEGASPGHGDVHAILVPEESVEDAAVDVGGVLVRATRDRIELFELGHVIGKPVAEPVGNRGSI